MPRRPPVGVAALALLAACSSGGAAPLVGVRVPPVNGLSPDTLITCRSLMAVLPDVLVDGVERVQARPASDTTAAYGEPAITVRCGVPDGSERDEPYVFNEVTWALHDTGATRTWTTRGREVAVEVVVPDSYSGQAELVGTVAKSVATAVKERKGGS